MARFLSPLNTFRMCNYYSFEALIQPYLRPQMIAYLHAVRPKEMIRFW